MERRRRRPGIPGLVRWRSAQSVTRKFLLHGWTVRLDTRSVCILAAESFCERTRARFTASPSFPIA
jgi:hypothetical protein